MKKVIVSLLVLAFVALAATGTVSAQCAAKPATTTSVATTCAQCTSCTTSTCCNCACPTTSCCPTVACCVVKQCCEVKTVKAMPAWTPVWKPAPVVVKPAVVTPAAAVAVKGVASASSASSTQTQSVTITGNSNVVNFENNTINNSATSVAVNVNAAVAWGNATAKNVVE